MKIFCLKHLALCPCIPVSMAKKDTFPDKKYILLLYHVSDVLEDTESRYGL